MPMTMGGIEGSSDIPSGEKERLGMLWQEVYLKRKALD